MTALVYSVALDNGDIVYAGTEETPELRKQITNPAAWGEPEVDEKPAVVRRTGKK